MDLKTLEENSSELRAYLDKLDEQMSRERIPGGSRSLHAWMAIQRDTRSSFSLSDPIMDRVSAYFSEKYGPRSNADLSLGRVLIMIGHEAWVLRFPFAPGRTRFVLDDHVEEAPTNLSARLTLDERSRFDVRLPGLFAAFWALARNRVPPELVADWRTAVDQAVDPRGDLGLSKWSSQQATEKVIKTYIRNHGGNVPRKPPLTHEHELAGVFLEAESNCGLRAVDKALLSKIECRAGTRYPDSPNNNVTLLEAVDANQASVLICGAVAEQW
jgi:hypothetical protein